MKRFTFVAVLPLFLGGCAATLPPEVSGTGDPADATLGLGTTGYSSPIAGYVHREPVSPKPWRQLNDAQSPAKGDAS